MFNTFCHTLNIFSYFFSGIEDTLAKNKNIVIIFFPLIMQHKTIIATCAAMAAFSGMATADIQLPLDVLNANNGGKTFSAQLGAGYATKYISRGLAFQKFRK